MSLERSRAVVGMQDCFVERQGFQPLGYLRLGKIYFLCFLLYAAGLQQKVERRRYCQVSVEWCYVTERGLLASGEWQHVIARGRVMFVRERRLMSAKKLLMIDRGRLMFAGWWCTVEGERYPSLCCLD